MSFLQYSSHYMESYKTFINLLEQEDNNLSGYPLKSIYRKLKKIMDTDFDTIDIIHTPRALKIFGEYDENRRKGSYCGKLYEINKETWEIETYLLGRVHFPTIESIPITLIINK